MSLHTSTPAIWTRRLNGVFLFVGAIVLGWTLYTVGLHELGDALLKLGWGFLLLCVAHLVALALDAETLRACAGKDYKLLPYWHVLHASLAGHAINEATPLSKLGEVTKFTLLSERVSSSRAAAALIVQNIVMFVTSCMFLVVAAVMTVIMLDPNQAMTTLLLIVAGVFILIGAATLIFMYRGPGELPFRLARRLGFKKKRVERWRETWKKVEANWNEVARDRRNMYIAWITQLLSRIVDVSETVVILAFLGSDNIVALAVLTRASTQIVTWLTSFIPMQAGTAEGSAYLLYKSIGSSANLGVMVEFIRRIRRLVFIGLGVALLGWHAFEEFRQQGHLRKGHGQKAHTDEAHAPKAHTHDAP